MDRSKDKLGSEAAHLVVVEDSAVDPLEAALEAELDGHPDRLLGLVLEDRYRILEKIDSGGMGSVYRAEQLQLKRQVAVKVLHPKYAQNREFRRRFEREALAASKATHPSCIAVLDFGTVEERPYLVMEYVEGPLLTELMEQDKISAPEAVVVALQLLEALRHAHGHGIVHRDVKPDNVIICHPDDAGTQVKLLDFGLAKNLVPDAPDSRSVTRAGTICGTPSYMSPEQGVAAETDARSDLYSLGVVLYQMACGRTPFLHEEMVQLIQAHLTEPPPRPREVCPQISPELEHVLLRALQKQRDDRFQSAEEFIDALRAVPEAGESGAAETVVMPASRGARLERLATAATVQATAATVQVTADPAAPALEDQPPEVSLDRGKQVRPGPQLVVLLLVAVVVSVGTAVLIERYYPVRAGPPELEQAARLLEEGKLPQAERLIRKAIARRPADGRRHLMLGHIYHRKLWRRDSFKEYVRAIERSPELRADPTMLSHVIADLRHSKAAARAMRFLERSVGQAAVPALQRAREGHSSPQVRRRAARTLARITAGRRRSP